MFTPRVRHVVVEEEHTDGAARCRLGLPFANVTSLRKLFFLCASPDWAVLIFRPRLSNVVCKFRLQSLVTFICCESHTHKKQHCTLNKQMRCMSCLCLTFSAGHAGSHHQHTCMHAGMNADCIL